MKQVLIGCALCLVALVGGCGGGGSSGSSGDFILIAFDDSGDLFSVDETTAATTFRLDTFYMNGGLAVDLNRVSASTYVPALGAIWIGGGGSSACRSCILVLNTTTGEATLLFDNSGINRAIPDLALRASDGAIFTTQSRTNGFRSVNNVTGEITNINSNTNSGWGNGLTFADPVETLYLAEADNGILCTVDPATGSDAFIATITYVGVAGASPGIVAMTTRPSDGVVFVVVKDGAGGGGTKDTYLGTLNTTTAVVTIIGLTTTRIEGLAFVPRNMIP